MVCANVTILPAIRSSNGVIGGMTSMRRALGSLLCLTTGCGLLCAQSPTPRPFRVVRLDPALDDIISTDAKLETLGEHFGLTEGPVWVQEGRTGYLLFSDCAANVIYKWAPNAPLSVFLEKSGYTGTDVSNVGDQTVSGRLAILLIGSNGLALDAQGRLIITAMTDRNVTRLEKDGTRTVLGRTVIKASASAGRMI